MSEAKNIEWASAVTSRLWPAGRLIVGERDEYLHWRVSDTRRENFEGALYEAPGDPESSQFRHNSAMVLGADREELTEHWWVYGRDPVAIFTVGEKVLAGAFDFDVRPPHNEKYQATLGIGRGAVAGTIAVREQDNNTLMSLESAVRIDAESGQPGVPYEKLRELYPQATWL